MTYKRSGFSAYFFPSWDILSLTVVSPMQSTTPHSSQPRFLRSLSTTNDRPPSRSTYTRGQFPTSFCQTGQHDLASRPSQRSHSQPSLVSSGGLGTTSGLPSFSHWPASPATSLSQYSPRTYTVACSRSEWRDHSHDRRTGGRSHPPCHGMYTSDVPSLGNISVNTVCPPSTPPTPTTRTPMGWVTVSCLTGSALPNMSAAPVIAGISAEMRALPLGYVWVSNHQPPFIFV